MAVRSFWVLTDEGEIAVKGVEGSLRGLQGLLDENALIDVEILRKLEREKEPVITDSLIMGLQIRLKAIKKKEVRTGFVVKRLRSLWRRGLINRITQKRVPNPGGGTPGKIGLR